MENQFKVSIIICVYNEAQFIETNLFHIAQQKNIAFDELEIILIDNNSNDGTAQIALSYWQKINKPFLLRIEHEEKEGKPNALKKAILISKNNLLLICDGDNYLDSNYVRNVIDTFIENPTIGILGGTSILYDDDITAFPSWMYEFRDMYVLLNTNHLKTGFINNSNFHHHGAGSAFQKTHINKLFSFGFDFISLECPYLKIDGADSLMFKAYNLMGLKNYFSKKLIFYHDLRFGRITLQNHYKQIKNWGYRYSIYFFYQCIFENKTISVVNLFFRIILRTLTLIFYLSKTTLKLFLKLIIFHKSFSMVERKNYLYNFYQIIGMLKSKWLFNYIEETRLWVIEAEKYALQNDK